MSALAYADDMLPSGLADAAVGIRRTRRGGQPQRYVLNEPGRRLLIARYDGKTATIDELTRRLHVPRHVVRKWAQQLGLARVKEPRWTAEETAFLERYLARRSVKWIAQKLNRSQTAVRLKAKRIGVRKSGDGYTMRVMERALGCDHHKIERWVRDGWLKATRRQTERTAVQGGDMWLFQDRHIRDFIRNHPAEIDPRRVLWVWVVGVLTGAPRVED